MNKEAYKPRDMTMIMMIKTQNYPQTHGGIFQKKKSIKYKIKKMDKHEENKLYANNIHFVLWVCPIHTQDLLCYNIHDKT